MPAREWWTCSIPSACARSGILAVCLIVYRRNAARMSMIPFSLVEMCAKSMCYNRRAYAPRTRGKRHRPGDPRRRSARAILRPALRQIQFAIDQRVPATAGIGEKHPNLAVLDAPGGAAVLPRHPGRFAALLEKTGLINPENAIGRAQVLDDILPT